MPPGIGYRNQQTPDQIFGQQVGQQRTLENQQFGNADLRRRIAPGQGGGGPGGGGAGFSNTLGFGGGGNIDGSTGIVDIPDVPEIWEWVEIDGRWHFLPIRQPGTRGLQGEGDFRKQALDSTLQQPQQNPFGQAFLQGGFGAPLPPIGPQVAPVQGPPTPFGAPR